ncbi:uncharacterized protein LOC106650750 isoform X1 [Trichogramma pretiosum]|uniref:uncharacterized protein LOC106650750 isoform X1 n=1 Tax=Trichogramma pretiosum TaxID=7493 RepID=UPI0006C975F3|nr:uncharacterized protein LOC106650750 isoform X1 [Trichogramma pretiosum]
MYVTDGASNSLVVKEERPDEAEIKELAAKMVEAHKAKNASAATATVQASQASSKTNAMTSANQNLSNLLACPRPSQTLPTPDGEIPEDDESQKGRFGWTTFHDCHIPYIYRGKEKYCPVRILEVQVLNKYISHLSSDIFGCQCVNSYMITEAESRLLNEINNRHCENKFGRDQFTTEDCIVRLVDAREFYIYLDICYTKLNSGSTHSIMTSQKLPEKCGFIRINKESVVPYTVKDNLKYVPLFYFEGETENLKLKAEKLEGWDLVYLKFCCKVQGIRNELFSSETCSVISLNDIRSYFPPGTGFEDYWPNKVTDCHLLTNNKSGGSWLKPPIMPPVTKKNVSNSMSKNMINARGASLQNMLPRGSLPISTVQKASNQRSMVASHPSIPSNITSASSRNNQLTQSVMNVQASVNGWNGLVSGQAPTYPLVSQANTSLMRMNSSMSLHNSLNSRSINNRGSTIPPQQYGTYPVSSIMQTPPLIRTNPHSNQPHIGYPTYEKDDWVSTQNMSMPSPVTANTYPILSGLNHEQVQALSMPPPTSTAPVASSMLQQQRHTPPVPMSSSHGTPHITHNKYPPPPLIPVNGNSNNTRESRGRPLIIIAETHPSVNCPVQPYQIQKALIEDKLVPCINFKPYIYSELLMTLPDFVSEFFPTCNVDKCRQVLDVLNVELYQCNSTQMEMLLKNGKCSSLREELPLIQVRSIMKFMPQLKYMLNQNSAASQGLPPNNQHAHSSSEEHSAKKRQRTS